MEVVCCTLQCVGRVHNALLREGLIFRVVNLHGVRNLTDVVVPQNIAVSTGLLQDSVGDDVAAFEFFNETLAFLVNQNGAVKTCVCNQFDHAGDRVADRIGLDVAHVDELTAGLLCHVQSFTGGSGGVGCLKAFVNSRVVLLNHLSIGAETAGS